MPGENFNNFQYILALVLANWSALGAALKCADRIEVSRNLLLGINNESQYNIKKSGQQFLLKDIVGYSIAMPWVLVAVGAIIFAAGFYLISKEVDAFLYWIYFVVGGIMVASSIGIAAYLIYDYKQIVKAKPPATDFVGHP